MQTMGIFLILTGNDLGILAAAMLLLGLGTAFVDPTLLAAMGDVAHPSWHAWMTSVCLIYTFPHDQGFAPYAEQTLGGCKF